jgi:acetylglutamate kinase
MQFCVIKLGGKVLSESRIIRTIAEDLVLLSGDMKPVVIHGGGNQITYKMEKFGMKSKFINGLRVTDEKTLGIVIAILSEINTKIVRLVNKCGGKAVGFSGASGLFLAEKEDPNLGLVGRIKDVNPEIISLLIKNNYIPVILPLALDKEGNILNINADTSAGALASKLRADKLIILSNKGILRDPLDEKSLIKELKLEEAKEILSKGFISGGMIPKLKTCINALENGVGKTQVIGCKEHALLKTLTHESLGTTITK